MKLTAKERLKQSILFSKGYLRAGLVLALDVLASLCASFVVLLLIGVLVKEADLDVSHISCWLLSSFVISAVVFKFCKVYQDVIRYATMREMERIMTAGLLKEIFLWAAMVLIAGMRVKSGLLAGMILIDFFFTVGALSLIRVVMILIYDNLHSQIKDKSKVRNVLVYGIDDKAVSVMSRLQKSTHYKVMGFIVPGKELAHRKVTGHPVAGFDDLRDIERLVEKRGLRGIIFPRVEEARAEQERLVKYCREVGIKIYAAPEIGEVSAQMSLPSLVSKIKIEDLLGRDEIKMSMNDVEDNFKGKCVLVTGAAGSIGSELCRQLARFDIKRLILFDNGETPMHNLRLELEDTLPDLDFVPVIGDVRSQERLDFVFRKFKPQIVFHAAAYKHVPLMEENPCEAILVNVKGSRNVADKCVEYGIEKMVMVSTDKAVNPTNIMGCTKRLAEIYVQSLGLAIERGEIKGKTKFITTRFGNVLGSNGSVIPRFREQIEHGGPVTVTHPEIRRFFMTIPEACRLVMEASTFATGTQIFVFDMGEAVKINTLAERMIRLSGLRPGEDIEIIYTGLRPGEKLYEEVLALKENTIPTQHERIFVAKVREYPYGEISSAVESLGKFAVKVEIPDMVRLMKRLVPEYKSNHSEFEIFDKENDCSAKAN